MIDIGTGGKPATARAAVARVLQAVGACALDNQAQPQRNLARERLSPATAPASGVATETDPALDVIFIEGFVGDTVIGIHHDELHATQPVRIDLYAGVPRPRACDSDRIGDTIDYSVVRTRLLRHLREHRLQLLEAFAEIGGRHPARASSARAGFAWWSPSRRKFDDVDGGRGGHRAHAARAERRSGAAAAVLSLIGAGMVPGKR